VNKREEEEDEEVEGAGGMEKEEKFVT